MRYFDHDTSASDDDKIMALRIECGGAAVDAYWAVLELMYRDETDLVFGRNRVGTKALYHRLCVGFDDLSEWLSAMERVGLLRIVENAETTVADGDDRAVTYSSDRATANIDAYSAKRETARENGKRGGRKPKPNRVGSKSVSKTKPKPNRDETEGKAKEKEKEKSLVTHKGLPNDYATGAAAAAGAAPPAAFCPLCDAPCFKQTNTGRFECPSCHDTWSKDEAVWR